MWGGGHATSLVAFEPSAAWRFTSDANIRALNIIHAFCFTLYLRSFSITASHPCLALSDRDFQYLRNDNAKFIKAWNFPQDADRVWA
jgi:hypothetical protein